MNSISKLKSASFITPLSGYELLNASRTVVNDFNVKRYSIMNTHSARVYVLLAFADFLHKKQ
jgi:hypothetical protein